MRVGEAPILGGLDQHYLLSRGYDVYARLETFDSGKGHVSKSYVLMLGTLL